MGIEPTTSRFCSHTSCPCATTGLKKKSCFILLNRLSRKNLVPRSSTLQFLPITTIKHQIYKNWISGLAFRGSRTNFRMGCHRQMVEELIKVDKFKFALILYEITYKYKFIMFIVYEKSMYYHFSDFFLYLLNFFRFYLFNIQ